MPILQYIILYILFKTGLGLFKIYIMLYILFKTGLGLYIIHNIYVIYIVMNFV